MAGKEKAYHQDKASWKRFTAVLLLMLITGLAACCALHRPAQAQPIYHVLRVVDGDTLEIVDAGGIRTRVRLRDVDAPELDEPGGPEAAQALRKLMLGRRVKVTPYTRDRYGRLVADVEPE